MGSTALLVSEDQYGNTMITGSWATAQRTHAFLKTATSLGSFVDWLYYIFDSHERPSRGEKLWAKWEISLSVTIKQILDCFTDGQIFKVDI